MKLSLISVCFFLAFLPQILTTTNRFSPITSFLQSESQAFSQHPELVNLKIFEVYHKTIKRYAKIHFNDLKMSKSVFSAAYETLSNIMYVDQSSILSRVVEELMGHYLKIATTYNNYHKQTIEGSECDIRTTYVKEVLIYLMECQRNNVKHAVEDHLTFLEFIYRFANSECDGFRFLNSIQYIYHSIAFTNSSQFFDLLIQYFDSNRPTLSVFYLKFSNDDFLPLKHSFIKFLTELYEKIEEIDHINDNNSFNRHACMCISSIVSCSFYDEFIDIIRILMAKVDMKQSITDLNFALSSIAIINSTKQSDSWYVNLLTPYFLNENLIHNLDPENFIDYGSLMYQIYSDHRDVYDEYLGKLTSESEIVLNGIITHYVNYFESTNEFSILHTLKDDFISLELDDFAKVYKRMENILEVFPKFSKHCTQITEVVLKLILDLISELISQFTRNFNPKNTKLNFDRLLVLVKLSTISVSGNIHLENSADSVVKIMFIFNLLCQSESTLSADQLLVIEESISLILKKLIENDLFIKGIQNHKILYKFLENISPSTAIDSVCMLLSFNLENSSNKIFTLNQTIKIINNLKIDLNNHLLEVLLKFIIEFIKVNAVSNMEKNLVSNNILDFRDDIFNFHRLLLEENLLSKTQRLLLKNFIENLS